MPETITPALVCVGENLGDDKAAVIRALAERVAGEGRASDADALFEDAWAREQQDVTGLPGGLAIPHAKSPAGGFVVAGARELQAVPGLPGGIAIPHAKSPAVTTPSLAFARLDPPVAFGAADGPADLVFLIAAPADAGEAHLQVLSKLARSLIRDEFTTDLRQAATADEVVHIVRSAISDDDAHAAPATGAVAAAAPTAGDGSLTVDGRPARIVAVTACTTGIAHTFMAADSLTTAGKKLGVDLVVEPQGSSGYQALPQEVIDAADAVIFATEVDVRQPNRFAGKPVVRAGVRRGIEEPEEMITEAVAAIGDPDAPRVTGAVAASSEVSSSTSDSWGSRIHRMLLTGVSYMIPFVAGGGLLIALGFLFGGYNVTEHAATVIIENSLWDLPAGGLGQYVGSVAFMIGSTSMGFLVAALAGFMAFSIADRPGIAPGFVAGAIAVIMNAGFIGGIIGGILAGFVAWWLGKLEPPRWLRSLMPVVIIPLLGSIIASGLMVVFLGKPIASLMNLLNEGLNYLAATGALALVGAVLGAMICFDMGGPVNKIAYAFATTGLASVSATDTHAVPFLIMAAVMAGGMVPPFGLALASTVLARNSFTPLERENGKAAWLLGAVFITEGAIPFAATDPLRVIPANIAGGAVAGGVSAAVGVSSLAPHGGIFVFFAIDPVWGFVLALVAGTLTTAFTVLALKKWVGHGEPDDEDAEATPVPVSA